MPEIKDSDFTWKEFIGVNNSDLVGLFGNLVNRVLTFANKNFEGCIPKGKLENEFKNKIFNLYCEVGDKIEEGRFKSALESVFSMVKMANKFFDDEKPWISIKKDKEKCAQSIYICIQFIANLSNLIEPFMPFTSKKIRGFLELKNPVWMPIEVKDGKINNIEILFEKIDKEKINEEIERLKQKKY